MKVRELQTVLRKKKIGYAVLLNTSFTKKDPNIFYFAQADIDFGALVIPAKGKPALFIPGFEYERIKKTTKLAVKKPTSTFKDIKKQFGNPKRIAINAAYFSLAEKKWARKSLKGSFVDISQDLADLRIIKKPEEVKHIRKACQITTSIINDLIKKLKGMKSEQQIYNYIEYHTRKKGCTFSFEPIIASGKNAYYPHHIPTSKLYKGFLVMDSGVRYKGYCSDMTRTVYLGTPTKKERDLYNKLLDLQKKAIAMVKPGQSYDAIEAFVRAELGKLDKYFVHSLGHQLGIEVHDAISKKNYRNLILKPGMVVTVEPGVYIKNKLGIRIEDDVVVTATGHAVLTKTPKQLISIPVKT